MGAEAVKKMLRRLDQPVEGAARRADLHALEAAHEHHQRLRTVEMLRDSGQNPIHGARRDPGHSAGLRPLVLLDSGNFATAI
jgi:hypothetical protein